MSTAAFEGERHFLSNFSHSTITFRGRTYPDVETAFQAAKTADPGEHDWVAGASRPGEAKARGAKVRLRDDWEQTKTTVMAELLAAKFSPGSALAAQLEATGDDELVEHNDWGDRHWGRTDGVGTNMLGRLLMARRAILRARNGATVDSRTDLWDLWASGTFAVIPTNRGRRANGEAVMGAGVAGDAAKRFEGIARCYGKALGAGNDRIAYSAWRVLCAPTKNHWRDRSQPKLIAEAGDALAGWAARHPAETLAVPALGAGLGGLDWDSVADILLARLRQHKAVLLPPRS